MGHLWQQTYAAFLRHGGYHDEDEVNTEVNRATEVVNKLPEPYKSNLVKQLNAASHGDFVQVDFDLIESIFTGKSMTG